MYCTKAAPGEIPFSRQNRHGRRLRVLSMTTAVCRPGPARPCETEYSRRKFMNQRPEAGVLMRDHSCMTYRFAKCTAVFINNIQEDTEGSTFMLTVAAERPIVLHSLVVAADEERGHHC
jgi:hypothetical protein